MTNSNYFLEVAFSIGADIAKSAIWEDGQCSWITQSIDYYEHSDKLVSRSIDHGIYGGVAGVSYFLSDLYALSKDPVIEGVLEGSINTMIENYKSEKQSFNFYNGNLGILYVILKAAIILDHEEYFKFSSEKLTSILNGPLDNSEVEWLQGLSGCVTPILNIEHLLDKVDYPKLYNDIGNHLLSQAIHHESYSSWRTPIDRKPLTGHSHGASGVVHALLELYNKTGTEEYYNVGKRGLVFEQLHFNQSYSNWLDLRDTGEPYDGPRFGMAWCHGAPGAALSRLLAWQVTKDSKYKKLALTALQTTKEALLNEIEGYWKQVNYSLCHGIAGNASILLYGGLVLGNDTFISVAKQAGIYGADRFYKNGFDWPGGLNNPNTHQPLTMPGLYIGLAGTGSFYLELADPKIKSIFSSSFMLNN